MLENLRLVLMGHDPDAGGTRLIPVDHTNLLHNALVHVAEHPPSEVLHIGGDRSPVQMEHREFRRLMPKDPVEMATALKAPKDVVESLQLAAELKDKLMVHAGETGEKEGGREVLDRVLASHREVLAQKAQPDPKAGDAPKDLPAPVTAPITEQGASTAT